MLWYYPIMANIPTKFISPEKQVEIDTLAWGYQNGFCLDVYDSEAIFTNGRKVKNPGVKVGTSDLIGNSPEGLSAYLELKDPKKGKVCRIEQYNFLRRKIESNAFALVVSDVSFLAQTWSLWLSLRKQDKTKEAREFLLGLLPKKVLIDGKVVQISI